MKDKLRLVFLPFVLALAGLTVGYTLLNWLLFVKLGLFHPKESLTQIVFPLLLAGATSLFYIAPKLKALKLKIDFYHTFLACLGLLIPTIFAQKYMTVSTGRLTTLPSVELIGNHEPTKYYEFGAYSLDTTAIRYYATYKVTGKNANNFNMYLYAIMPLQAIGKETHAQEPTTWMGVVYEKEISNHSSDEKKERIYNAFIRQSQIQTEHGDFTRYRCFERIDSSSDDYEGFTNAFGQEFFYRPSTTPIILRGMTTPYEARGGDLPQRFFIALFITLAVWLLLSILPKTNPKEIKRIKDKKPDLMAQAERQEWLNLILPQPNYFVTPILMHLNTAVFLLMVLAGKGFLTFQADDLLAWGACYAPLINEGQWWRMLTATFLHGGVTHLLANLFCLFYVGIHLETLMSRCQYLCVYLLSALAGSAVSLLWHAEPVVAVGASGAIFGLYGAYIALLLGRIYPKQHTKSILKETAIFIGFNLLMGILPGIDNAAHIGGLLCGIALGFAFLTSCKQKIRKK